MRFAAVFGKGRHVALFGCLLAWSPSACAPPPTISGPRNLRVGILEKYAPRALRVRADAARLILASRNYVVDGTMEVIYREAPPRAVLRLTSAGGTDQQEIPDVTYFELHASREFTVEVLASSDIRTPPVAARVSRYAGILRVAARDFLRCDLELERERYVNATARAELGELTQRGEMSPVARRELLGAMRVAVRSYALSAGDRHPEAEYDLCDLTHCMYFPGVVPVDELPDGDPEVLLDARGRVLPAYFHSTCGGRLGGPESYWPGSSAVAEYRRGPDAVDGQWLCADSPHYRWRADLELNTVLPFWPPLMPSARDVGRGVSFTRELVDGRVTFLSVHTPAGSARQSAAEVLSRAGRVFGWNVWKSNDFQLEERGPRLVLSGRGLGHGVGLCQWGAAGLARRGRTRTEILEFYFPGARLARVVTGDAHQP